VMDAVGMDVEGIAALRDGLAPFAGRVSSQPTGVS
jgi:hypothetical protein